MTKLRPLNDYVLVKRQDKEEKVGGIHIPTSAQVTNTRAEVIAVGPGRHSQDGTKRIAIDLRAGDVVCCPRYGGQEVKVAGEDYVLFHEDELYGFFQED